MDGDKINGEHSSTARKEAFSDDRRNRSSSRSSKGRVEKRIEATMANAEPASTARSRKSSHILGLFKENTTFQEPKRSQDKSRTSPSIVDDNPFSEILEGETDNLEARDCAKGASANVATTERDKATTNGGEFSSSYGGSTHKTSHSVPDQNIRQIDQKSPKGPAASSLLADVSNNSKADDNTSLRDTMDSHEELDGDMDNSAKSDLLTRLLEEIRNYHNLVAPLNAKFKHKSTGNNSDLNNADATLRHRETSGDKLQNEGSEKLSKTAAGFEEDEESDKEQISSALYYPHQAPSPDALQDVSIHGIEELGRSLEDLDSRQSVTLSPTTSDNEIPSEDVDIALQSHNKSRYLHGDLQKARKSLGDSYAKVIEGDAFSASESDYESLDEAPLSVNGEDSSATDDAETTPRATPNARSPFLRSRHRKGHRLPAAPLGAVELKPYNHQVGGHTTVFRFSKRAVCKQLSNRENEFYEVVERRHPELLRFLPRYGFSLISSSAMIWKLSSSETALPVVSRW